MEGINLWNFNNIWNFNYIFKKIQIIKRRKYQENDQKRRSKFACGFLGNYAASFVPASFVPGECIIPVEQQQEEHWQQQQQAAPVTNNIVDIIENYM